MWFCVEQICGILASFVERLSPFEIAKVRQCRWGVAYRTRATPADYRFSNSELLMTFVNVLFKATFCKQRIDELHVIYGKVDGRTGTQIRRRNKRGEQDGF